MVFFSCYLAWGDVVIVCEGKVEGCYINSGWWWGETDRARERERGGQERNDERDCAFPRSDPWQHARPPLAGDYADPLSLADR